MRKLKSVFKIIFILEVIFCICGSVIFANTPADYPVKIETLVTDDLDFPIQKLQLIIRPNSQAYYYSDRVSFIEYDDQTCIVCNDNHGQSIPFTISKYQPKKEFNDFYGSYSIVGKTNLEPNFASPVHQVLLFDLSMRKIIGSEQEMDLGQKIDVRLIKSQFIGCGLYCSGHSKALEYVEATFYKVK